MKKILIYAMFIFLIGSIGYFVYEKVGKAESTDTGIKMVSDTKREKVVGEKESVGELKMGIPIDKVWEYSFESTLNESSVSGDTVSIVDDEKQKVDIDIQVINGGKTIQINPPKGGYLKGKKYELIMKSDIEYDDGDKVSDDYRIHFMTERDEVGKAVLNSEIKTVEEVEILKENVLIISKDALEGKLITEDIIIVPSAEHPEGQALKITSVEDNLREYTVQVEEPEFEEIYQELDMYKSFPISSQNFSPEKGVEGLKVVPIDSAQPITLVHGTNTGGKKGKLEFREDVSPIGAKINEGLQITFSDMVLNEDIGLALDGTFHIFSPKVNTDFKVEKFKIDYMNMEVAMKTYAKFVFKQKEIDIGKKKVVKTKDLKNIKIKPIKIGKINIPTPVAGLVIQGNLLMKANVNVDGGLELTVTIEEEQKSGVHYQDGEMKHIYESDFNLDVGFQGNVSVAAKAGPVVNILATGFGVVGVGFEGMVGAKFSGSAAMGIHKEIGAYNCSKKAFGGFGQMSLIANALDKNILEFTLAEFEIGHQSSVNDCEVVIGFAPIKPVSLKSSQTQEIKVENLLWDILSDGVVRNAVDMDNVVVSVSEEGVVKVEKGENGIVITSEKAPSKEKVDIIITQIINEDEEEIVLPIIIKDYKEIQDAQNSLVKWNGEWVRDEEFNEGTMNISNFDGQKFNLSIGVQSGGNTGDMIGVASVNGNKATYIDTEYDTGCRLNMTLQEGSVLIQQTPECGQVGGMGTYFDGEYTNAKTTVSTPSNSLSSKNIMNETNDSAIQQLLGDDYGSLVENMQMVNTDGEKYGLKDALLYEGGVRGMYTINEGIILIEPSDLYYVANIIDGRKVKFYTNDPAYREVLPSVINQWRGRFSTYPVEYVYKEIN